MKHLKKSLQFIFSDTLKLLAVGLSIYVVTKGFYLLKIIENNKIIDLILSWWHIILLGSFMLVSIIRYVLSSIWEIRSESKKNSP